MTPVRPTGLVADRVRVTARDGQPLLDVGLRVGAAGRLGVLGPSGAGKSLLLAALAGLIAPGGPRAEGHLGLADADAVDLAGADARARLADRVVVLPQDAVRALNPCRRIGRQLTDTLRHHGTARTRRDADAAALEWLARVGLPATSRTARAYPHELSGGMRQRVVVALALCGGHPIVLADEPTTALDTVAQARCLDLLDRLCTEQRRTLVLVGHDLAVVCRLCDELLVLDAGRVVERGSARRLFGDPTHPVTRRMVRETRRLREALDGG